MNRRQFLASAAAPMLAADAPPHTALDPYWLPILDGFLRNARATSSSFAVCDFPDGTILKASIARSGKTYDSVTRMMPALAAWAACGRASAAHLDALRQMFIHAFDPAHPDYWMPAGPDRSNQRQVESSIVAWSLWLLRDKLLPGLTSRQRANIHAWLASCTQVPVRRNNWAWFTAVNQAARLDLAKHWPEFSGDAEWMAADLQSLDDLAVPGDGWYSDSPTEPIYDYYNFWVFASHFLYWRKIVGPQYPKWEQRFTERLRLFLEKAPCFFGANGSHVLYGRSLIYRWAVLAPLVLAYEQKLWPHSPGLLRAIVRRNLEFHWKLGSFDPVRGKLRETYSATGTHEICDSYVDNGHPYWGMQAMAFYLIPASDPFWHAPEDPLPIDRGDFRVRFESLGMMLAGVQASGQVRWLQARSFRGGPEYRDKYTKFSYSSHFAFNIVKARDHVSPDTALYFRNPKTGAVAARGGISRGKLIENGVEIDWWTDLEKKRILVNSRIELFGDFERRTHTVSIPHGMEVDALEGSYALGCDSVPEKQAGDNWVSARSPGGLIVSWAPHLDTAEASGNILAARSVVHVTSARLSAGQTVLRSLHYASSKPLAMPQILEHAKALA